MAKTSAQSESTIEYDIPYVPSSDNHVETMIKLAAIKPNEKAVDLGAGEGKLVMALAKEGAIVTGIEIDPGRSLATISKIIASGLQDRARVVNSSFWEQNLQPYDVIVLYGVPSIMKRLEAKIMNECKAGIRVVSNYFTFPNWQAEKVEDNVYLYKPLG